MSSRQMVNLNQLSIGGLRSGGVLSAGLQVMYWGLSTAGVLVVYAGLAALIFVVPATSNGLQAEGVFWALVPVATLVSVVSLLMFRSAALLRAQGYRWNVVRLAGAGAIWMATYLGTVLLTTVLPITAVIGFFSVGVIGLAFYPVAREAFRVSFRHLTLIVALAIASGSLFTGAAGRQTIEKVEQLRSSRIVRKAPQPGDYQSRSARKGTVSDSLTLTES